MNNLESQLQNVKPQNKKSKGLFSGIYESLKNAYNSIKNAYNSFVDKIKKYVYEPIKNAYNTVKNFFENNLLVPFYAISLLLMPINPAYGLLLLGMTAATDKIYRKYAISTSPRLHQPSNSGQSSSPQENVNPESNTQESQATQS